MRPFFNILFSFFLPFLDVTFAAITRRGDEVSTIIRSGMGTSTITALTFFTPSPGAELLPITSQSQIVTTYLPVMTICPLTVTQSASDLPLSTWAPNVTSRGTAASNIPVSSGVSLYRRQVVDDINAPYANSSIPTSTLSSCSVFYTPTTTSICHTTLSPLASPVIPITDCYQRITFSTDHGYTLASSAGPHYGNFSTSAAASVETLTSFYVAPWQYVYSGVPADAVDVVVCSTSAGTGVCTTTAEDWAPGTGWIKATNTIPYTLGAPVTGVRIPNITLLLASTLLDIRSVTSLTCVLACRGHHSPFTTHLHGTGRSDNHNVTLDRSAVCNESCNYDHRSEPSKCLHGGSESDSG